MFLEEMCSGMSGGLGRSGPVEMVPLSGENIAGSWDSRTNGLKEAPAWSWDIIRVTDRKSGTPIPEGWNPKVGPLDKALESQLSKSLCAVAWTMTILPPRVFTGTSGLLPHPCHDH